MSIPIVMPRLGLTMVEGTISEWLKKPGDVVRKNEPLFIISTDKVEMEVESMVEGTLREILVPPGETVPVGTAVAYVEGVGESVITASTVQASVASGSGSPAQNDVLMEIPSVAIAGHGPDGRAQASPRAKRLAKQLGVDLASVQGTDREGRISEEDVRRAAESTVKKVQPNLKRRQLIAERLTHSIQTVPTFSLAVEVNAERLLSLYEDLRESVLGKTGVKLTITDLLLTALSSALKSSPKMNAAWEGGTLRSGTSAGLGLAWPPGKAWLRLCFGPSITSICVPW
jgi:pyruvate dehydrogenase E2 component (dihydrolipoamide acetyltransferase)